MIRQRFLIAVAACTIATFFVDGPCLAQIGYGVNATGTLFSFDVNSPTVVTTIGPTGINPEGIDFRPSTNTLYAIDVGAALSQLYTLSITTGAATPVGIGFPSVVGGSYTLSPNDRFGFDFNPKTVQVAPDTSMRIRLVSTNGANLRLNSDAGTVAVVDTPLYISGSTDSPFVDAIAYINNIAQLPADGTTELYDMDARNDVLYQQIPPNNGTLVSKGPFGATIDANPGIHFDIFTPLGDADSTIGGDFGYAVMTRPDAPTGGVTPVGSWLLYNVNLGTGATTMGRVVGPAATPSDFTGGFAVNPLPEPSSLVLLALGATILSGARRRRD